MSHRRPLYKILALVLLSLLLSPISANHTFGKTAANLSDGFELNQPTHNPGDLRHIQYGCSCEG